MIDKVVPAPVPSSKNTIGSYFPPQPDSYENGNSPSPGAVDGEHSTLTAPSRGKALASPLDAEPYVNSLQSVRSSRADSDYSLSRISLSSQLAQLTALALPNPASLSKNISSISTALAAANTLTNAAEQIRKWLQKATEVLTGLDAEDDVEWAAAGGREGLVEVDAAIGRFEGLLGIYVTAIEDLQEREDVSKVSTEQLKALVDQMEFILKDWEGVRRSLREIKAQVELAMEWEELWNVILGDIGLEMETLSRLVFEMEEARYVAIETALDANGGLDMQELDTIVEEAPMAESQSIAAHHLSLPSGYQPSSPLSPGSSIPQDDSRLLALFARMQPLRASLDFLPMTLANFHMKAEKFLPSACQVLENRRKNFEEKWKALESDAQGLRQELEEDRWVIVFRNAGRQAQKLCESVERSISKLQEAIDVGTQHSNPPLLAKKVEAYEAKKSHYGPAIKKVLGIIEKGVTDRQTINGEILRVHLDTKARWQNIETDVKNMDVALEDLAMHKNQQLGDSISSIVSIDRSATTGSVADTPGSSPTSSVAMGPTSGSKREPSPGINASSRRGSASLGNTAHPNVSRRYFSMPPSSMSSSNIQRKPAVSRSFTSNQSSRATSPSPQANLSATPTPGARPQRPALQTENKPRWNSSPKVDYFDFPCKLKPYPFHTPPLRRRASQIFRSPTSSGLYQFSNLPLPSPLGRSSPLPGTSSTISLTHRPRLSTGAQTTLGTRRGSAITIDTPDSAKTKTPPTSAHSNNTFGQDRSTTAEESPSARPRPTTSMSSNRRISMLPVPKNAVSTPLAGVNGRESVLGGSRTASHGRANSLENRQY